VIGSTPVTLRPQETSMWCWAASGQMVMETLGHGQSQCTQANNRFGHTDCPCHQCTSPTSSPPCVTGGWPEFNKYGFTFKTTSDAALSWSDVRLQVSNKPNCKNKPFAYSWHWPGGGGHMMVANGYAVVGGANYVSILNPWAPCTGDEELITYDFFVDSPGDHTHWNDYYDVTYTGA
jgi:hypothetical protein